MYDVPLDFGLGESRRYGFSYIGQPINREHENISNTHVLKLNYNTQPEFRRLSFSNPYAQG